MKKSGWQWTCDNQGCVGSDFTDRVQAPPGWLLVEWSAVTVTGVGELSVSGDFCRQRCVQEALGRAIAKAIEQEAAADAPTPLRAPGAA